MYNRRTMMNCKIGGNICKKNSLWLKRMFGVMALFFVCAGSAWGEDWDSTTSGDKSYGSTTTIEVKADKISMGTIQTNRNVVRDVTLTINLNGKTLYIDYLKLGDSAGSGGKVTFNGPGTVIVKKLDTTTDVLYGTGKIVTVGSSATLKVTENWYTGDYSSSNDIGTIAGDGNIIIDAVPTINASNTNVTYDYVNITIPEANQSGNYFEFQEYAESGLDINNVKIWTGASSNDWSLAANWNGGVPDSTDNVVVIPSGVTNYPVSSAAINVKILGVADGAILTMNGGSILTVHDFKVEGELVINGSVSIPSAEINKLTLGSNSSGVKLEVNGSLEVDILDSSSAQSHSEGINLNPGNANPSVSNLTINNSCEIMVGVFGVNEFTVNGNLTVKSASYRNVQANKLTVT